MVNGNVVLIHLVCFFHSKGLTGISITFKAVTWGRKM